MVSPNAVQSSNSVQQQPAQASTRPSISQAGEKLWKKLSEDLRKNPTANWQNAVNNLKDLTSEMAGVDVPEDLRDDVLANIAVLEKSLLSLKCVPDEDQADFVVTIKDRFDAYRLDMISSSESVLLFKKAIEEAKQKNSDDVGA